MLKIKFIAALTGLLLFFSAFANAQTNVVPIVEMKLKSILGGVQNGKWLTAKQTAGKLKNNAEFVIAGLNGVEEGGITTGNRGEQVEICEEFYPMRLELEQDLGVAVGSDAKWNFVPRTPQMIALNNSTYTKIVAEYLKTKGIAKPQVKITQALRVDLEGDGQEEVLITATNYVSRIFTQITPGDYSLILLRKIVGGKAQNILVTGEFYTKKSDFAAPNKHLISAIADLNGDKKMEIVIYGEYYEGSWAELYELKGNKPTKVLETGCGA